MPESELGFRHILVCVCEFTNWMKTIPLADQKAQTIAMALYFKICCEYGTPKAIICDEAPAFQSSSVLKAPSRKLKRDWVGPFKIQAIIDYSHYMISDWTGQLSHKRFHVNRLIPFSLSLGKVKDGKLQTVHNTRELFRIWKNIKEDIAIDKNSRHTQT